MQIDYAFSLVITACVCAAIAQIAWERRAAPGAYGFMFFMLAEMVWAGTYAVRWIETDTSSQLFWLDATYFGVAFHSAIFMIFALQFTGHASLLTRRNLALLMVMPIITLVMLWTDPWHGLFYGGTRTTGTILNGGPWFWFFVFYTYLFIFIVIGLFAIAYFRASKLYRQQTGTILVGSLLPVTGNILSLAGFSPFPNLDITPFIFTLSGLVYAYGLFGFRFLDVVPVARDRLVEEMADGVIVLDIQNRIVDVNPAVQRLIGINTSAIGKSADDILTPRLYLDHPDALPLSAKSELRVSESPPLDIELRVSPLIDKRNNPSGRLVILHDITERKQAEHALLHAHSELEQRVRERTAELQEANSQLEKAARMKDEFLASMSHELRTPLTGILGLSEVLQLQTYGPLSEKQRASLAHINGSGRHLLELINDMLDYSRIGAGKFDVLLLPCSLAEVCQACLRITASQASARNLQSSFSIYPDVIKVLADGRRLKQMLVNLLGNAIKFTPSGGSFGIEVRGNLTYRQVYITVWDTGIGIKAEDQARLFQPFIQLDASLARSYAGTGLGLALVRRLAELQGGSVAVESKFGEGSRFTVTLPWPE